MVKGKGKDQEDRTLKSQIDILLVFADFKEHRYKDIKLESKSNDPTLQKYLKGFIDVHVLKKRIDIESGAYPYPVYYSLTEKGEILIKSMIQGQEIHSEVRKLMSDSTKSPKDVLEAINKWNNFRLLDLLRFRTAMKESGFDSPEETTDPLIDIFILRPYKVIIQDFIKVENWKIINQ